MIYILTGNIRTGKTTALLQWSKNRNDVDGLLCPDDAFGKRYFLKLKSNDSFPLEVSESSEAVISIGSFRFLKSAFDSANKYLMASAEKRPSYLVIDELGKLELKNEGLHESALKIIKNYKDEDSQHLILVVRSSLVETILKQYTIEKHRLISKADLEELSFT